MVAKLDGKIQLIKLTLPDGSPSSAHGDSWFNVAAILEVKANGSGSSLKLSGQKGVVHVTESRAEVEKAIEDAEGPHVPLVS